MRFGRTCPRRRRREGGVPARTTTLGPPRGYEVGGRFGGHLPGGANSFPGLQALVESCCLARLMPWVLGGWGPRYAGGLWQGGRPPKARAFVGGRGLDMRRPQAPPDHVIK